MSASRICLLFLCLFAITISHFVPAVAAEKTGDAVARLLEQAKADGLRVIILEPAEDDAPSIVTEGPGFGERVTDLLGQLVQRLEEAIAAGPAQFPEVAERIAAVSSNGSATWPISVVLITVMGLLTGHLLFYFLRRAVVDRKNGGESIDSAQRRQKIQYMARSGIAALGGLAFEVVFGLLLPLLVYGRASHTNAVLATVVELAIVLRLAMIFFDLLLLPETPEMRLVAIADGAAKRLHRSVRLGLLSEFVLVLPALLFLKIESFPDELRILMTITVIGAGAAVGSIVVWANRRGLAQLFAGEGRALPTPLAANSFIVIIAYFVVAWLVSSARTLLDHPDALGLVTAPLAAAFLASLIRGIGVLVSEHCAGDSHRLADEEMATGQSDARPRGGWIDTMAGMLGWVIAVIFVLNVWGISFVRDDGSVGFLGTAAVTILLAYAAWTAIRSFFDRKIAEEIGEISEMEGDEGGGAGMSRLGTLLPLARNVVLFALLLVAMMVMLIEAGIDIAPLFAGAGILGLAIGFGAQTLIRDIFSGFFFLLDDAFRKGEYVETTSAKGTVERISIRSIQLRHHNGPLHTIPFGEIQQLTNYSRDWVIMKLPLRLTLDTDPERVRKLIKKLGQEMLSDPMVGEKFLQPLKSQGVISIDNFGMVVRVKFMTRPGDQFITRRVVYAKLHELFEREGIEFASRDVRIRMDHEGEPSGEVARAAAVAAELADATSPDQQPAGATEKDPGDKR